MPDTVNQYSRTSKLILFPGCDPKQRLCNIFEADSIQNKPELVILNWLVDLPSAIDPAFAAQTVLIKLDSQQRQLSQGQQSLLNLLREIAKHPREKLRSIDSKYKRNQRRKDWFKRTGQRTFM